MRTDQDQLEKKLRQLTADRERIETECNKAESERDRLRARVGQLEQKLSLQNQQPPVQPANSRPAAATPPSPTREPAPRVAVLRASPETLAAVTQPVAAPIVASDPVSAAPAPVAMAPAPVAMAPAPVAVAPAAVAAVSPAPASTTATTAPVQTAAAGSAVTRQAA